MLNNYFTSAIRNIVRNRLYSIINIGGLTIGLAACLLIMLFVRDELSYDKWIPGVENLYAVETTYYAPGRAPKEFAQSPLTSGPLMTDKISEVVDFTRILRSGGTFTYEDKMFRERTREVDPNFFEFFDLPMVSGHGPDALKDNLSIIINEDTAQKYFGTEDPIGKVLVMNNERNYKVTGVFKNLPDSTHFEMEIIALFDINRFENTPMVRDPWDSANLFTYVKLRDGAIQTNVESQLPNFIDQNANFESPGGRAASDIIKLNLMPVTDIHLHANKMGRFRTGGDIMTVYTFSAVALLILIIASINFMNLATAQSMKRAREVSLRKVLGSSRKQLIAQFLGESILVTFFGLIFALALTELIMPFYNNFIGKELNLNLFTSLSGLLGIIGFTLTVGLISGLYPAFFLSSFRPSKVLRSNKSSFEGGGKLRNMLVIFQFSISIALIISTMIVHGQTYYAKNMDRGFSIGTKLNLYAYDGRIAAVMESLKQELKNIPGVKDLTFASDTLPQTNNYSLPVTLAGQSEDAPLNAEFTWVGPNYMDFFEINTIAGRAFSEDMRGDFPHGPEDETLPVDQSIVVNETFLKVMGITSPEDAIGQVVRTGYLRPTNSTIVGVIQDLNSRSIRRAATPMMYWPLETRDRAVLTLELDPARIPETYETIQTVWKSLLQEVIMTSTYVEDDFNSLYTAEEQRSQIFTAFSIFAVFISCLGLYALASFAAERRTKEIGLRKVLGADVMDIVRLLVWQFSKPVLWANLIAWPIAWYLMNDWLNGFEYRMSMGPMPFVMAGLIALAIAWGTVAHRATRVARTNPIVALRYE